MGLLDGYTVEGKVPEKDVLGGGGGYVWETDVYPVIIDLAYLAKSRYGALGLNLVFKDKEGRELKDIQWVASGDEKNNRTYYEKDGVRHNLPGLNVANAITTLAMGVPFDTSLPLEEKVVKVWDSEQQTEMPTKVEVIPGLLNKRIDIAVLKQIENKREKGDDNKYHPVAEIVDRNEIKAIFDADTGLTISEMNAGEIDPVFKSKWIEKWQGVVHDKTTKVNGGTAAPATGAQVTKSLFPSKK